MKVLAVNSSARPEGQSKTWLMLEQLTQGMVEAGAEVETVALREKKLKVCIGCFTCWTRTPGKCIHRDDMSKELFPKFLESDLVVYATPLFHHTVNATMKAFIERTLPIAEPFLEKNEDRWDHPLRRPFPGAVLLSVAGFPELNAFDAMTHYVNYLFGGIEGCLWAEIYRPASEAMLRSKSKLNDILDATRQAGRELVTARGVQAETLQRIQQPISDDLDTFTDVANCFWRTCMEEGIPPHDAEQKKIVPRPDSLKSFMSLMKVSFRKEEAGKVAAVLQFRFSGKLEGACHFRVGPGGIDAADGEAEKPDLVIRTPFEVWMDILTGKADGAGMMMEGKYQAEGNTDLLLDMGRLFSRGG